MNLVRRIKMLRIRLPLLFLFVVLLAQVSTTLAQDDEGDRGGSVNSLSGKFFEYVNNLRPTSTPNADQPINSTSVVRRIFIDNNAFQEAYQRFLEQVRKVRGMFRSTRNETDPSEAFNGTQQVSSNRTGRINTPWSWPWASTPTTATTPTSRNAFHRIFYGQLDPSTGDVVPERSPFYTGVPIHPPPSNPGLGRGNHYNYVYPYNPKTNTAAELERHTNTTIYIICICLIIMLVGTILFAFVSKCQESSAAAAGNSSSNNQSRNRRRRSQNASTVAHNLSNRPQISIISMPLEESAPPEYTKVTFDPPPSYSSLFPLETNKK